jgi:glycosyltransferase involved in cell wall biosynthesis
MKILVLYAVLFEYQINLLELLSNKFGCQIMVVYWDNIIQIPINLPQIKNVNYVKRSVNNYQFLLKMSLDFKPDLIYTSGWMDKSYVKISKYFRKSYNIPTIALSDSKWDGTLRQRFASLSSKFYLKRAFSHICVAGPYQYEYAKRLKFDDSQILFNALSANSDLFSAAFERHRKAKNIKYPHCFAFVGRFIQRKGLFLLFEAWSKLHDHDWKLIIIGTGPLEDEIRRRAKPFDNIIIDQARSNKEIAEMIKGIGCFVLPSTKEPWGIVLHEFACAGIPIISSEDAGAIPLFVINNYNGFIHKAADVNSLAEAMSKIINQSDQKLLDFSINSNHLGNRITPEITAASILSVIR